MSLNLQQTNGMLNVKSTNNLADSILSVCLINFSKGDYNALEVVNLNVLKEYERLSNLMLKVLSIGSIQFWFNQIERITQKLELELEQSNDFTFVNNGTFENSFYEYELSSDLQAKYDILAKYKALSFLCEATLNDLPVRA